MADARVIDTFSDEDVAAVRGLADAVEATTGASPFGEVTWTGLAGNSRLGDRGVILDAPDAPGGDGSRAGAYVHLAHHQRDEWSVEVAARLDTEDRLPGLLVTA